MESVEELTNGLLTDDYCHVCDAVLLFKSQRLSHYEVCVACQEFVVKLKQKSYSVIVSLSLIPPTQGKKHAQKLKVYLRTKRTEKMKKEAAGVKVSSYFTLCNFMSKLHMSHKLDATVVVGFQNLQTENSTCYTRF